MMQKKWCLMVRVSLFDSCCSACCANQIQRDDQTQQIQFFWRNCLCFSLSSGSHPTYKRFLLIVVSYSSLWDGEMRGLEARWKEGAQMRCINSRTVYCKSVCVCVWLKIEECGSKDPQGHWYTHTHTDPEVIASFELAKPPPRKTSMCLNYMSQIMVRLPEECVQLSELQHIHPSGNIFLHIFIVLLIDKKLHLSWYKKLDHSNIYRNVIKQNIINLQKYSDAEISPLRLLSNSLPFTLITDCCSDRCAPGKSSRLCRFLLKLF